MGHRNSPAQCHEAHGFRGDTNGFAGIAAEPATLTHSKYRLDEARSASAWLLLAAIRFYQSVFAPIMPVGCKFYPSCSHYAAEAIARHGARRGLRLAIARLLRCRPFTQGGVDFVPDASEFARKPGEFSRRAAKDGARSEVRL